MPSKTNEQALESSIEKRLTGNCLEELKQQNVELNRKLEFQIQQSAQTNAFLEQILQKIEKQK